jgi:hypothetical protein
MNEYYAVYSSIRLDVGFGPKATELLRRNLRSPSHERSIWPMQEQFVIEQIRNCVPIVTLKPARHREDHRP